MSKTFYALPITCHQNVQLKVVLYYIINLFLELEKPELETSILYHKSVTSHSEQTPNTKLLFRLKQF